MGLGERVHDDFARPETLRKEIDKDFEEQRRTIQHIVASASVREQLELQEELLDVTREVIHKLRRLQ